MKTIGLKSIAMLCLGIAIGCNTTVKPKQEQTSTETSEQPKKLAWAALLSKFPKSEEYIFYRFTSSLVPENNISKITEVDALTYKVLISGVPYFKAHSQGLKIYYYAASTVNNKQVGVFYATRGATAVDKCFVMVYFNTEGDIKASHVLAKATLENNCKEFSETYSNGNNTIYTLTSYNCLDKNTQQYAQVKTTRATYRVDNFAFTLGETTTKEFKPQQAFLVGDTITVLNNSFKAVTQLQNKTTTPVTVTMVLDSLHNQTDDYCNSFKYVGIKGEGVEGIVDGRSVYYVNNALLKKYTIELYNTNYYGIGTSNEDGLTFCDSFFEPTVLIDKQTNTASFIKVMKNEIYNKVDFTYNFDYLQLVNNDGAEDKVIKAEETAEGVILYIHREFQEGYTNYQILLQKKDNQYWATYLNYPEIEYNDD